MATKSSSCTTLEKKKKLNVYNVVYGLGGRDMTPYDIDAIFKETLETAKTGVVKEPLKYVGVRE